ncbi:unnamed protein product [Prorocentrum cordatum]|uniref:Uncharacterized protein n=1 Tax=Prorocentrum cordatum TaxID=2364126 RepID=A0ABN9PJ33_9DINO|nr:unnamed protein product [Polarella glacialis]
MLFLEPSPRIAHVAFDQSCLRLPSLSCSSKQLPSRLLFASHASAVFVHFFPASVLSPLAMFIESLNAFQARRLRRIRGISHSCVGRVSNAAVLNEAQRKKLSDLLSPRQLILFGDIARKGNDHPVSQVVFQPSPSDLTQQPGRRKRGVPPQVWVSELY